MGIKNKTRFWRRAGACLLAATLLMPVQIQAKGITEKEGFQRESEIHIQENVVLTEDGTKAERKIQHVHIGTEAEGSGCYTGEIRHVHEGNPSEGGACYEEPIYHKHTGNETEGGGCYGEEKYHVHEGNETEGGSCYGEAVYHKHAGSTAKGGGCYGKAVYHAHSGSEAGGGGCYGKAVYHRHTGSEAGGGGCYGRPVYHSHTGSASSGGGCYTAAVYHSHEGNNASGGACYQPVYHTHTDSCYEEAQCIALYDGAFKRLDECDKECFHHGLYLHMTFEGTFNHQSCGLGMVTDTHTVCWGCQIMDKTHSYQKITCGKNEQTIEGYVLSCHKTENTIDAWGLGCGQNEQTIVKYETNCGKNSSSIDSYQRNCGKDTNSVESYQLNCGKTEKTIESYKQNCKKTQETIDSYIRNCEKDETVVDAYALSCQKTDETIDRYELACGREENTVYANFSLWNSSNEWSSGQVILQALCENKENFLCLSEVPFLWEDGYTGKIEREEKEHAEYISCSRPVTENGKYTVRFMTENEDMSEQETVLSIEVKNIDNTAPVIQKVVYDTEKKAEKIKIQVIAQDLQPDGSSGSGLAQKAYSFDGGKTWMADPVYEVKENGTVEIAVRDLCGNIARESVEISHIQKEDGSKDSNENVGDGSDSKDNEKEESSDLTEKETEDVSDLENEEDKETNPEDEREESDSGSQDEEREDNSSEDNSSEDNSGEDNSSDENSDNANLGESSNKKTEKVQQAETQIKTQTKPQIKAKPEEKTGETQSAEEEKSYRESNQADAKETETAGKEGKDEKPKEIRLPEKTEEVVVKQRENNAERVANVRPESIEKKDVVAPVVKTITFTVSGVALAAVFLYLLYMMFRSIRVYHQDGEGGSHYAGSCMMKKTGNGFEVKLPDMIVEQSATGQFILRPGSIFVSRHKGEELMILAGKRKEAVWIDREIPLKLATFL